ncbi:vWA domain-containing protein [Actinomadura terrae]|uniref:vWA domain-containing protein n=1 Tax=Actinomadura terrae TaxID=604353 RepID=UPI001FA80738|nr:vWA domain-containing protein [Actinomadura terrae]
MANPLKNWVQFLGVAAPIAGGLAAADEPRRFPFYLAGVFCVVCLVAWWLEDTDRVAAFKERLARAGVDRGWSAVKVGGAALGGAAVVVAGWVVVLQARSLGAEACEPPPDVRVMAAPENMAMAQAEAAGFVQAESDADGCLAVRVTVFEAPPPGNVLGGVFKDMGVLTELPRPDVWLPATSAAVEEVVRNNAPEARLSWGGRYVGPPSPLVLVLSEPDARRLGLTASESPTWRQLAEKVGDARLLMPSPRTTETGLVGLAALRSGDTADPSQQRRGALAGRVDDGGAAADDPGEVLCRLRTAPEGDPVTAAVVPLDTVKEDRPGTRCDAPGARARQLVTVQPDGGAMAVDRPVVQVRWQDGDPDGISFAERFGDWLARSRPRGAVPAAHPRFGLNDLRNARALMNNAWKPRSVDFMLDFSRTMNTPVDDGTLLTEARNLVYHTLDRLGPNDRVGLWRFPDAPGGRDPRQLVPTAPADEAARTRIERWLKQAREADAETTPLYHAIAAAARRAAGEAADRRAGGDQDGPRALVVLTDGLDDDPGRDGRATRRELQAALKDANAPDVHVLALTGAGCPKELVDLGRTEHRLHCVPASADGDPLFDALFRSP